MFYVVRIENSKVKSKSKVSEKINIPNEYVEVSEQIYDSIKEIPCGVTLVNGEIVSVETIAPSTRSHPPTLEERLLALEETTNFLLGL